MWGQNVYPNAAARVAFGHLLDAPAYEEVRVAAEDVRASKEPATVRIGAMTMQAIPVIGLSAELDCVLVGDFRIEEIPRLYAELARAKLTFSELVSYLPALVMTARPDGLIDYWNRQWTKVTGDSGIASLSRLRTMVAPEDVPQFSSEWQRGIESRRPFTLQFRLKRRTDGLFYWQRLSGEPIFRSNRLVKWVFSIVDVDSEVSARREAEDAAQRLRFISEASRLLAQSFDARSMAVDACRYAVRWKAEEAAIWLGFLDGTIVGYPPSCKAVERLRRLHPTADRFGAEDVRAIDERHDIGSYFALPLVARDRDLGQLVLGFGERRIPDVDDIVLFEEFARRVSVALDNAQMYTNERHIATTLQGKLLPERLEYPFGTLVDAVYLPGDDQARVGGDWYDAFELRDGRLAVSVGDIAGHGVVASALMGSVRHALRAALLDGLTPGAALALANNIVYASEPGFATAFVGIVDTLEMALAFSTAGHLPPILLENGTSTEITGSGVPLGVFDRWNAVENVASLPRSGALALYTDGFVEHQRNIVTGMDELRDILATWSREGMKASARELASRILRASVRADDAALLLLRFDPIERIDMTIPAHPKQSQRTRHALLRFARDCGLDNRQVDDLVLAACEAINNAIEHAYPRRNGSIRVQAAREGNRIVVTIGDGGRWNERGPNDERGRGLTIMHALSDNVEIQRDANGTSVRLAFDASKRGCEASLST